MAVEWVPGVAYDIMRGRSGGRPVEWIAPGTINLKVVEFSDTVTRSQPSSKTPSKAWSNPYAEPSPTLERHALTPRQQWANGKRVV